VICLVNTATSSSGEGVPMAIKRLSQGHVLGLYGTSGSFGLTSGETLMPGGLSINYPLGRSLDENFNIQLDSDSTKNGGVIPDIRVLLTQENMYAMYVDSVDVDLDSAVTYLNSITSLNEEDYKQPKEFRLFQNYPNPFNSSTVISYSLPFDGFVTLKIYDILGKKIETLLSEFMQRGNYQFTFNSNNLPSGIYFYRLQALPTGRQAGSFVETKKMVLIK